MSFLNFKESEEVNYKELPDEDVLRHSVSKPELFSILIERYEKAFLRKAQSILRSPEEAEDVVQEAFTKIYLNALKFQVQEGASFKSWGYKILMNTSFTAYQKLKKRRENTLELSEDLQKVLEDPATAGSLEKREMSDYVARVLTQLPKALSKVLRLHLIERMPQKEIAEMENLSVGAVKTRIYRAKKEFKKISDLNLV
jgi:RNA polymerase sigma-70 factor, ECF subfamily